MPVKETSGTNIPSQVTKSGFSGLQKKKNRRLTCAKMKKEDEKIVTKKSVIIDVAESIEMLMWFLCVMARKPAPGTESLPCRAECTRHGDRRTHAAYQRPYALVKRSRGMQSHLHATRQAEQINSYPRPPAARTLRVHRKDSDRTDS
jgi:hypothetical protein